MQEPTNCNECNPCLPTACDTGCALEVIDSLLRSHGDVRGDEVDSLLDLRWLVNHRDNAEATLALFCTLRRSMETRHYLAFYRLRRWLQNHLRAEVRLSSAAPTRAVQVKLDRYCLEAIRSSCVLAARQPGEPLQGSRVRFEFVSVNAPKVQDALLAKAR